MALTRQDRDRLEIEVRAGATRPTTELTSFTAACALRPGLEADRAQAWLSALPVGVHSPFASSARTHFARLLVIEQLVTHERHPLDGPVLILSADLDGDAESYLVEVLSAAGPKLAPVLGLCADAPNDPSAPDFVEAAVTYLMERRLPVGLQYANSPGRSTIDIRLAVERHRRLAGFALGHQNDPPRELRESFLEAFGPRPEVDR